MARRDLVSAAGLALLAIAYLVATRRYALDTLAAPGPGVFPLAIGLAMLALAIGQAMIATRGRTGTPPPGDVRAGGRALALAGILVGYVLAVGAIGFLTASAVLVLVSSRLLGARDWLRPAVLAAGMTVAAYLIFVVWLAVPLPKGALP